MEIVVVGGCGFIGKSVSSKLIQNNHRVISIHSQPHTSNGKDIDCRLGNFGDVEFMRKILRHSDCLIHLGARYTPVGADRAPHLANFADLYASERLIETAISIQTPQIVFASSGGAVYGNLINGTLAHENLNPHPTSRYGQIKLSLERILLQKCQASPTKFQALRISNAYGPGQTARASFGAIPTFLNLIEKGLPLTILNSNSSRDYVYIDDVSEAFLKTLEYKGAASVINIGTGVATTPIELVDLICKLTGRFKPSLNYSKELSNAVSFNVLDISLARQELAWMPKYDLVEGLKQVIAHRIYKAE